VALGEKVFEAAVTHCVFVENPKFRRKELEVGH